MKNKLRYAYLLTQAALIEKSKLAVELLRRKATLFESTNVKIFTEVSKSNIT